MLWVGDLDSCEYAFARDVLVCPHFQGHPDAKHEDKERNGEDGAEMLRPDNESQSQPNKKDAHSKEDSSHSRGGDCVFRLAG